MQQIRLIDPVETGRQGGIKRATRLTPAERRDIAKAAATARWHRQEYQTAKRFADMMVQFAKQQLRSGSIPPQV